jgi:hypothetical protein
MANTLRLKRSSVASKVAATTDLQLGELAINTNDGRMFTKRNAGSDEIVEFLNTNSAFKTDVVAATTANIALTGAQTIDGVSVVALDRVLVKDQSAPADNGIYIAAASAWARATDCDTASDAAGAIVTVTNGTVNGGLTFATSFKASNTLGTTAMVWNQLDFRGDSYLGIVSAAGTTTLTASSQRYIVVTGTQTQTIVLPAVSTLPLGTTYLIHNLSTGQLTVQSSGANTITSPVQNHVYEFRSIATTGTGAAVWNYHAAGTTTVTGTGNMIGGFRPTISQLQVTSSTTFTAGTNAQGQGVLSENFNVITTAATNPSGVTLPTAGGFGTTASRLITIVNKGANPVNIYPVSGGQIDALGTNTPMSLAVNAAVSLHSASTTQWYSSVTASSGGAGVNSITFGTTGLTPSTATTGAVTVAGTLNVANGGTGATDAATARTNLGAAPIASPVFTTSATVGAGTGAPELIVNGGAGSQRLLTFETNGSNRFAVGLDQAAESGSNAGSGFFIARYSDAGGYIDAVMGITRSTGVASFKELALNTDLAILHGGTGASDAAGARTNLGIVIGTDIQAYSARLAEIAALSPTADNFIVGNGTSWTLETPAAARTSLGLKTGAQVAISVGTTAPGSPATGDLWVDTN